MVAGFVFLKETFPPRIRNTETPTDLTLSMNRAPKGSRSRERDPFSLEFLRWLEKQKDCAFFESRRLDRKNFRSYLFVAPAHIVVATSLGEVESALTEVQRALDRGSYAAGFVSYEAGYAFESALGTPFPSEIPLVWFGIYRKPIVFNTRSGRFESGWGQYRILQKQFGNSSQEIQRACAIHPTASMSEEEYTRRVGRIAEYIVDGYTYQTNYTFKLRFDSLEAPAEFYHQLRRSQLVCYSAFLNAGETTVLSLSPELFFRLEGSSITLRPMKGTAGRGKNVREDKQQRMWLKESEKDRAENLMIVDLLRNDVGRIARTGSVHVRRLFAIERYETVFQLTSTIQASLRKGTDAKEIFRALFPCGSVTGAPKIKTMQIIRELEQEARGGYTGAIGFFGPDRRAVFSVAIRTLVRKNPRRDWEIGVGSGIVHDSAARAEYAECLLKSRFVTERSEEFRLFETMRFDLDTGWSFLPRHLARLRSSCLYFEFPFARAEIIACLDRTEREIRRTKGLARSYRVKLILYRDGMLETEVRPLGQLSPIPRVGISDYRTNSDDRFLYHKTTNRRLYDEELARAVENGWFDILFLNERGEVTEGARSNIVIKRGGEYFTPPSECGILPGVFRSILLRGSQPRVCEKVVTLTDLQEADEIYVCNALRGMIHVTLAPTITALGA